MLTVWIHTSHALQELIGISNQGDLKYPHYSKGRGIEISDHPDSPVSTTATPRPIPQPYLSCRRQAESFGIHPEGALSSYQAIRTIHGPQHVAL